MQKIILVFVIVAFPSQNSLAVQIKTKLAERKKPYTFALIGDAHGILGLKDLALVECRSDSAEFDEGKPGGWYWKCFSAQSVKFDCGVPYDLENDDEKQTYFVFSAVEAGRIFEYSPRRHVPLSVCKSLEKSWKRLSRNQDYVCLMGIYHGANIGSEENLSTKKLSWTWSSLKTKRGCVSDFPEDCNLALAIKKGCRPSKP
jgi:hypothetical protein